jgi:hypothetical protein
MNKYTLHILKELVETQGRNMFLLTFSGNETESIVNKSDNTTELV